MKFSEHGQLFESPASLKLTLLTNRTYGSGYPLLPARQVTGRGFPFGFWPLAWGAGTVAGGAYIYDTQEVRLHISRRSHPNAPQYGLPDNSTRPGGVLVQAAIPEPDSINGTTYRFIADTTTVEVILADLTSNCSAPTALPSRPFDPSQPPPVDPSQVIQYYRASSAALTREHAPVRCNGWITDLTSQSTAIQTRRLLTSHTIRLCPLVSIRHSSVV
jgi:hypothetical protein